MFPGSIYVHLGVLLAAITFSSYVTHAVDLSKYQAKVIEEQKKALQLKQEALDHENLVVYQQAKITQDKQKEKDDLQIQYNNLISKYRGVQQQPSNGSSAKPIPAPPPVPIQGLKILEQDVEFLIGFARDCSATEIERNEVIGKYNAL